MFKAFKRGEKGFTLIELLVVITILGVLAAVVIPQLVAFIGRGKVESANTEAHQVALAVVAYMTENNQVSYTYGDIGPATVRGAGSTDDPLDFMTNPGSLQATYGINADGSFASGTLIANSKWTGLEFDETLGKWAPAAASSS